MIKNPKTLMLFDSGLCLLNMSCCYLNTNVNIVVLQTLYHRLYLVSAVKTCKIYRFLRFKFMIICSPKFLTMRSSSFINAFRKLFGNKQKEFPCRFCFAMLFGLEMKVDQCETNSETIF